VPGSLSWHPTERSLPPRPALCPVQDEVFTVISGTFGYIVDGKHGTLPPGGSARIPAGRTHMFYNAGANDSQPLTMRFRLEPCGQADEFFEVHAWLLAGGQGTPAACLQQHARSLPPQPRGPWDFTSQSSSVWAQPPPLCSRPQAPAPAPAATHPARSVLCWCVQTWGGLARDYGGLQKVPPLQVGVLPPAFGSGLRAAAASCPRLACAALRHLLPRCPSWCAVGWGLAAGLMTA